jgi:hypothetical protein
MKWVQETDSQRVSLSQREDCDHRARERASEAVFLVPTRFNSSSCVQMGTKLPDDDTSTAIGF